MERDGSVIADNVLSNTSSPGAQYAPLLVLGDTEQGTVQNHKADNSGMLYAVYKKNWYNDEPADNYVA